MLSAAPADAPVSLCIDRSQQGPPPDIHWYHHWRDGNEVVLSLAKTGADYWLRFPDLADFLIQPEAGCVQLAPNAPANDYTVEHLLVDQVLPRLLAHHGHLVVHASAVTLKRQHVLFLGPSGWGKSTLAGLLQQQGHTVHSDDCVQIRRSEGRHEALPTYPSLRLYDDSLNAVLPGAVTTAPVASYSEKRRVPLSLPKSAEDALPVDALYLLGNPADANADATVRISPLRPAQACQALIAHSFRLDLADRDGNASHFVRCAALANAVPAFRLDYPRDFTQSNALVKAIIQHLSTQPAIA